MNIWNSEVLIATSFHIANALFGIAGKSFLILAAALLLTLVVRRGAAATRHFIWLAGLASLLALPLATFFAPHWSGPAWTGAFLGRPLAADNEIPTMVTGRDEPSHSVQQRVSKPAPILSTPTVVSAPPFHWQSLVLPGWAIGVAMTSLVFVEQRWRLRKIQRTAHAINNPALLDLRDSILGELQLRRNVRLLETEHPLMPMTWGYWRPAALLPAEAATWEPERLRLVLRHELAHARRGDCLAQTLASLVCALYWFNPLAWLAAARMRVERERACDDLVVAIGQTPPSEYAGHLLDIARRFSAVPRGALPVAKRSGLEQRLRALLDDASRHGQLTRGSAVGVICALAACVIALAGCVTVAKTPAESLRQEQISRLRAFSAIKEKQSEQLAAAAGEQITPRYREFFAAALRGDGNYITNEFEYFKKHHPQYATTNTPTLGLRTSYWSPVLEVVLGYKEVLNGEPEYVREFEQDIIQSIPDRSIYFGGTDPGRGLITAFSRSQPEADPFFTLTQNALADGTYLDYLREMYGARINQPTKEDIDKIFANYIADAKERLAKNELKPGENVTVADNGRVNVSGKTAVMIINGMIAKWIFDRNPHHKFYLEESFPLDWMYPYLDPHGLIMKINRSPSSTLSADAVQRDQQYWQPRVREMIGDWLQPETPLSAVIDFVDKTYGRKDLSGFTGNPHFVQSANSQLTFSKLRSAIASVYAWRLGALKGIPTPAEDLAPSGNGRRRMIAAADLAFRQAFALCPYLLETVNYANFLVSQDRKADAIALLEAALRNPGPPDRHFSAELALTLAALKKQ
jgi:beta-lactamase regulating signal transducer with metallopeptidase domain